MQTKQPIKFKLCNDGFIRDVKYGAKVGKICKTKDGYYFDTDNGIPLWDHEIDHLWDQFENNREAFEISKKPFESPKIERLNRDPFDIVEDIEMGYEISHEDEKVMEHEYGPNWRENFFGDGGYGQSNY